jgi:hypothetical protein
MDNKVYNTERVHFCIAAITISYGEGNIQFFYIWLMALVIYSSSRSPSCGSLGTRPLGWSLLKKWGWLF